MTLAFDPTLTSAGLIAINGALAFFLGVRDRSANLRREESVREALQLLTLHVESLEALDDPAVPFSLRQLALDISDLLHDADVRPDVLRAARYRARQLAAQPRNPLLDPLPEGLTHDDLDTIGRDLQALTASRPDLAAAFGQCIVSGVLSFERMYPECAGALGLRTARIVASPVAEAERVLQRARDMVAGMAVRPSAPIVLQP